MLETLLKQAENYNDNKDYLPPNRSDQRCSNYQGEDIAVTAGCEFHTEAWELRTRLGAFRIEDVLVGELLPRIC